MLKNINEMRDNNSSDYTITLTNVAENESYCYSLPIIKGYISTNLKDYDINRPSIITLRKVQNNNGTDEITTWPVICSNFKCLANLDIGKNHFILEFENGTLDLFLEFKPKKIDYHVLPIYIICKGDDGKFQAPKNERNSVESACKRIHLGSKLIQSFTAEKLYENNMGRKTFQLASDNNVDLKCVVFKSKLTSEEVYEMKPEEIWEYFGRELMSSSYGSDKRKFLAFLSCTKYISSDTEPDTYEKIVAQMKGHVALGGGGLAIFGTGCLYTWPESIDQIVPRFLDDTKVDKTQFMDDSCYRGTYGSCFSTTLGSVCHELGHAFDLGHSKRGIMARGFDNINLVFMASNHLGDPNKNIISPTEAQHATVTFTRNLNVIYSMSSPILKSKRKNTEKRSNSPQKININSVNTNWNLKPCSNETVNDNDKKRTVSKLLSDDLTFWDKSCSALLKYHKWFADSNTTESTSSIEFNSSRHTISSHAGIRVVELRGNNGLVLASWEFIHNYLPKQFVLPTQNLNIKNIQMVVAEDSLGNLLKESLTLT